MADNVEKDLTISFPDLEVIGEFDCTACPVQAVGTVAGHAFYFRSRWDTWEFTLALVPDLDPCGIAGEDVFYREGPYGKGPYDASYMPLDVARQTIRQCAEAFLAERHGPPFQELSIHIVERLATGDYRVSGYCSAANIHIGDHLCWDQAPGQHYIVRRIQELDGSRKEPIDLQVMCATLDGDLIITPVDDGPNDPPLESRGKLVSIPDAPEGTPKAE